MGHIDHGKTTLTAGTDARARRPETRRPLRTSRSTAIDRTPEERQAWQSRSTSATSSTRPRDVTTAHVDMPGHADYVKNMITGAAQVDAAILVVSATDGSMPQTARAPSARASARRGVGDRGDQQGRCRRGTQNCSRLVELEMRDMLTTFGYPGDQSPVRRRVGIGSAAGRSRLGAVDRPTSSTPSMPSYRIPSGTSTKPFLMRVENVMTISGRGNRRHRHGSSAVRVAVGDAVDAVGFRARSQCSHRQPGDVRQDVCRSPRPGDNCAALAPQCEA